MKIRTNFVSNSSSSSFILSDPSLIKYFGRYETDKVYSTNEVKQILKSFIINCVNDFDFNDVNKDINVTEMWEKYLKGNVPDYFEYEYLWDIENLNFGQLREIIRLLPDNKWITDSYDRNFISEYCHLPDDGTIKCFESDL